MGKLHIVEQIIAINNETVPAVTTAANNMNALVSDMVSGYQKNSIEGSAENQAILDRLNKGFNNLNEITDFLKQLSSGKDSDDQYNMRRWSNNWFALLEQKVIDCLKGGDDKAQIGTVMSEVQGIAGTFSSFNQQQLAGPQALQKELEGLISTLQGQFQVPVDAATSLISLIGLFANLPKN